MYLDLLVCLRELRRYERNIVQFHRRGVVHLSGCVSLGLPKAGAGHWPPCSDPLWTSLYEARVRNCSPVLMPRLHLILKPYWHMEDWCVSLCFCSSVFLLPSPRSTLMEHGNSSLLCQVFMFLAPGCMFGCQQVCISLFYSGGSPVLSPWSVYCYFSVSTSTEIIPLKVIPLFALCNPHHSTRTARTLKRRLWTWGNVIQLCGSKKWCCVHFPCYNTQYKSSSRSVMSGRGYKVFQ